MTLHSSRFAWCNPDETIFLIYSHIAENIWKFDGPQIALAITEDIFSFLLPPTDDLLLVESVPNAPSNFFR